jgi:hypothetical protein
VTRGPAPAALWLLAGPRVSRCNNLREGP